MIQLPPGVTVNYFIAFELDCPIDDEMANWFEMIGGVVSHDSWYDSRGRQKTVTNVKYGKGKRSYYRQDGSGGVRIQFHGEDAVTASVFLIKFMDHIQQHNFKEYQNV
jgi:hypothetical protein